MRIMIAAAAVVVHTAASAAPSITFSQDGFSATIEYRDLKLSSPADRSIMTGRIRRAASLLCFDPYIPDPLAQPVVRTECYRKAVESGVGQMDGMVATTAE